MRKLDFPKFMQREKEIEIISSFEYNSNEAILLSQTNTSPPNGNILMRISVRYNRLEVIDVS